MSTSLGEHVDDDDDDDDGRRRRRRRRRPFTTRSETGQFLAVKVRTQEGGSRARARHPEHNHRARGSNVSSELWAAVGARIAGAADGRAPRACMEAGFSYRTTRRPARRRTRTSMAASRRHDHNNRMVAACRAACR